MNKIEENFFSWNVDKEKNQGFEVKAEDDNWAFGMERYTERNRHFE